MTSFLEFHIFDIFIAVPSKWYWCCIRLVFLFVLKYSLKYIFSVKKLVYLQILNLTLNSQLKETYPKCQYENDKKYLGWSIGKPGVLQSLGSERVWHNLATDQQQHQRLYFSYTSRHHHYLNVIQLLNFHTVWCINFDFWKKFYLKIAQGFYNRKRKYNFSSNSVLNFIQQ